MLKSNIFIRYRIPRINLTENMWEEYEENYNILLGVI